MNSLSTNAVTILRSKRTPMAYHNAKKNKGPFEDVAAVNPEAMTCILLTDRRTNMVTIAEGISLKFRGQ